MATLAPSDAGTHRRFSFLHPRRNRSASSLAGTATSSSSATAPPPYSAGIAAETTAADAPARPRSSVSADAVDDDDASVLDDDASILPAYEGGEIAAADGVFHPTLQLQIDTFGKRSLCDPQNSLFDFGINTPPNPTCVYLVDDGDGSSRGTALDRLAPAMQSLRKARSSNSCTLVTGGSYGRLLAGGSGPHEAAVAAADPPAGLQRTLATTTYRIGPRAPRTALFSPAQRAQEPTQETAAWDYFAIRSKSIFNRTQTLRTRLGSFEWRYATADERRALSRELADAAQRCDGQGRAPTGQEAAQHSSVDSLLVLDRITQVYASTEPSGSSRAPMGKPRKVRQPVARLIRSPALRTPGTTTHAAGNGGRLQLDLRAWTPATAPAAGDHKAQAAAVAATTAADERTDREMLVVLAVSSCITMLKKEVDRRKDEEVAIFV